MMHVNDRRRRKAFAKLDFPLIQGGMGVGISMGRLAGSVACEGGMGVLSTANIGFGEDDFWKNPQEANRRALRQEIEKAKERSGGRGLLAVNAMVATTNFLTMAALARESGIDAVIAGAGMPLNLPEADPNHEILLAPIVSGERAARLLRSRWERNYGRTPDFLVVEGAKAGGHLGFSKEELTEGQVKPLEEIVSEVAAAMPDIPVFAGGGVFDHEDICAMQSEGAFGAQIATRFIATPECDATQGYKDVILRSKKEDVRIIQSPVGMPGRAIASPLIERIKKEGRQEVSACMRCIRTCDPKTTPYCINRALIAAFYGDWENGLFFSGANVERVNQMMSVHDLMRELKG